jgi:hypothetical protein
MRLIVENLLDLKTGEQESYWRDRPAGEYDPVQTEKMYWEKDAMGKLSIVAEFWEFLRVRKKFWLRLIMIILVLVGAVIIFAKGSAVDTLIWALF